MKIHGACIATDIYRKIEPLLNGNTPYPKILAFNFAQKPIFGGLAILSKPM